MHSRRRRPQLIEPKVVQAARHMYIPLRLVVSFMNPTSCFALHCNYTWPRPQHHQKNPGLHIFPPTLPARGRISPYPAAVPMSPRPGPQSSSRPGPSRLARPGPRGGTLQTRSCRAATCTAGAAFRTTPGGRASPCLGVCASGEAQACSARRLR